MLLCKLCWPPCKLHYICSRLWPTSFWESLKSWFKQWSILSLGTYDPQLSPIAFLGDRLSWSQIWISTISLCTWNTIMQWCIMHSCEIGVRVFYVITSFSLCPTLMFYVHNEIQWPTIEDELIYVGKYLNFRDILNSLIGTFNKINKP
jgi:hypothetical protein